MVIGNIKHVNSQQYLPHYFKQHIIKTANWLNKFQLIYTSKGYKEEITKILAPSTISSFKANHPELLEGICKCFALI